jgi:hypothetical protein
VTTDDYVAVDDCHINCCVLLPWKQAMEVLQAGILVLFIALLKFRKC